MGVAGILLLLGFVFCHLDGKASDAHFIGSAFDGSVVPGAFTKEERGRGRMDARTKVVAPPVCTERS